MKTIVAVATPLLTAAIHIIRVSGPQTYEILSEVVVKPIHKLGYTIQHNQICDGQQVIDDVLLNLFVAPKSFTGEDVIEINCHGSVLITKQIINLLIQHGCTQAQPGEFSMQALMNQKMNYYQIEAMNNFIHAKNITASQLAFHSMLGKDLEKIINLQTEIFKITGSIEVNIDYPEYDDVPQYTHTEIIDLLTPIIVKLQNIYDYSKQISPIFQGLNIAIIGKPNVGKSSLMNLLTKQNVAIVSDVKGTTRDVIKSEINFNGITLNLLDTAGLHTSQDKLEQLGIGKTNEVIKAADLVIWLLDSSNINLEDQQIETQLQGIPYLKIYNKNDLIKAPQGIYSISVKNNEIQQLLDALNEHLQKLHHLPSQNLVLQSDRQLEILKQIIAILSATIQKLRDKTMLDLLQSDFEECILLLNQLLGETLEFNKLDELFKHFCLGK